jgi:hypothetical protein
MPKLSWEGVVARRMVRHGLAEPILDWGPADAARALCGAHAQVMTAAELSVGRRLVGSNRSDVRRALWDEHTLVKAYGPRGTVHLLPVTDLPMWTGALTKLPPSAPVQPEPVRFTPGQAEDVIAAIGDALAHEDLTVDELTDAVVERCGPWAGERTMDAFQDKWPRWRQLTSIAGHRGVLCFGPNRGRQITYTNPARWLPGFEPDDGDAAVREVVRRYLYAYGPATPQNFAKWMSIPPKAATSWFSALAETDELDEVDLEGTSAWVLAGDTDTPSELHKGVRLLPYFDNYVVGGQPRDRLYPGPAAKRALTPAGQAGNFAVVLVDGIVGGVWHQKRSGKKVAITVEPLRPFTKAQRRELDDEVDLVGAIVEATPTLSVGPVTTGAHA